MKNVCLSFLFVMGAAGVVFADQGVANRQTDSKPAQFHAVSKIQAPHAMSDKQLAAIEGAMSSYGPKGGVTWPFGTGGKK